MAAADSRQMAPVTGNTGAGTQRLLLHEKLYNVAKMDGHTCELDVVVGLAEGGTGPLLVLGAVTCRNGTRIPGKDIFLLICRPMRLKVSAASF